MIKRCLLGLIILQTSLSYGQFFEPSDSLNKARRNGVYLTEGVLTASSYFLLDQVWYQYYDRESFHLFNDNPEWLQIDKAGHVMTSYYVGQVGYGSLKWAGMGERKAIWIGGTLGSAYLLGMEVLDGFASDWGFSIGDVVANAVGTGLFIGQQLGWKEQRITVKFSSHLTPYYTYKPNVLGRTTTERLLKDYNGQTYWLSANLSSFTKYEKLPWLNIAVGYGGEDMIAGRPVDEGVYAGAFNRYRQLYLSPDIDFTRIPTSKKWLKPILRGLNIIKFPFPTIEMSKEGMAFYFFYF